MHDPLPFDFLMVNQDTCCRRNITLGSADTIDLSPRREKLHNAAEVFFREFSECDCTAQRFALGQLNAQPPYHATDRLTL